LEGALAEMPNASTDGTEGEGSADILDYAVGARITIGD
jgi:hypothetical protein